LRDPQQLNLYLYARDNPLVLIDPTGLDVTCTGDRCSGFYTNLQKDASFKMGHDKNGKVTLDGAVDKKHLSKADKALLDAITDTKHHVNITAEGGATDGNVQFGSTDHNGNHTIAFDQTALLDQAGGPATTADVVGHEVLEGYAETKGNDDPHEYANQFFPGFDLPTSTPVFNIGAATISGYSQVSTLHGTGAQYDVQYQFVTPIPKTAVPGMVANHESSTERPRYPVGVEKQE
jgi:hypothetical protein